MSPLTTAPPPPPPAAAPPVPPRRSTYDPREHYTRRTGPVDEFGDAPECEATIRNVGWTLGNDCPFRCRHCYSMSAREKGRDFTKEMADRVVSQLAALGVETVNLGGNEPLFTNGPNPRATMLPYIIRRLAESGIDVGLTTSGISLLHLYRDHRAAFDLLNDVDVSFDSPFADEHDANRGARLFHQAVEAMEICAGEGLPRTVIMCGMAWNFTPERLHAVVDLAARFGANLRINPIKPVEGKHMELTLSPRQFYEGFSLLLDLCAPIDLGEPPLAAVTDFPDARRCPCGRTSFRIHSITPEGAIHVSPCVYLHDYKTSLDVLRHDLRDIVASPQFRAFRQRNRNPGMLEGCAGCDLLDKCGGGCAARSYLHHVHETGVKSLRQRDPYCPREAAPTCAFPQAPELLAEQRLVHMDYLCTWIGRPKTLLGGTRS